MRIIYFLLFATILESTGLYAQRSMRLEDCIEYALKNHPKITLAQLAIRDADWQIRENAAVALPQFTAGVNFQHFLQQPAIPAEAFGFPADPGTKLTFALRNNISGTVGVNQLLFNNSYLLGIKVAREYRKYVDLQMPAARNEVRNAVIDAYLPALLLAENVAILEKNIEVQGRLLRETQEVVRVGFAEQLDADRLDYILSTLRTERDNLIRQRDILIDMLQFTMYMPVQEDITLSDDLTRLLLEYADTDTTAQLNPSERPEYNAVLKAGELSQIQVDLYDKNWLPTLAAFAQYQPSFQGNDQLFWIPAAVAGVQLNIPIYDGGLANAKKERAIVTAMEVDVQKEQLLRAFDLELETARKLFVNATARVQNEERNLDLAQRIHDTAETKFRAGVGSSLEVTQAQAGLYQSQAQLIQARYELLHSRVAIRKALGK